MESISPVQRRQYLVNNTCPWQKKTVAIKPYFSISDYLCNDFDQMKNLPQRA